MNGRIKCVRAKNNTIYGMPASAVWAQYSGVEQTPCFIGSERRSDSVFYVLLEVIGGEGVRIYSADTAKTGHLPFKKIPEPGWFGHAGLSLVGGEILDEGQQELRP